MTQPTNPMSELKAKDCPICGAPADRLRASGLERLLLPSKDAAACSNGKCALFEKWIPLDKWNNRPREQALEGALRDEAMQCLCELVKYEGLVIANVSIAGTVKAEQNFNRAKQVLARIKEGG